MVAGMRTRGPGPQRFEPLEGSIWLAPAQSVHSAVLAAAAPCKRALLNLETLFGENKQMLPAKAWLEMNKAQ